MCGGKKPATLVPKRGQVMSEVRVPEDPSDEMREAFNGPTPYIVRKNKKYGKAWEIVRQDHPEWREVMAPPMTVMGRFATYGEAAVVADVLEFEYRYAEMLRAAGAIGSGVLPTEAPRRTDG